MTLRSSVQASKAGRTSRLVTRVLLAAVLLACLTFAGACSYLRGPIDRRTGFSSHLHQVESNIQAGEWALASASLKLAVKDWKRIMPFVQVDIDHDYINQIGDNLTLLSGYIESRDKSGSLPLIRLVQETWGNLGSR